MYLSKIRVWPNYSAGEAATEDGCVYYPNHIYV